MIGKMIKLSKMILPLSRQNDKAMNTQTMNTEVNNELGKTIVAFHIGRGGEFYNQGHRTFLGEKEIGEFTDDLFLNFENQHSIYRKIQSRYLPNLSSLYDAAIENIDDDKSIAARARIEKFLGVKFGELVYFDEGGNPVDLTAEEEATGLGRIDCDGEYDTTYTKYLEDCTDEELRLIVENRHVYVSDQVEEYAADMLFGF
ncbi:MAG: hypothetical protein EBX40_00485 [Gammaproteobacteria bacterium]|nr:hypothetical protein [Gammaproteobacteria bacterium]